MVYWGCLSLFFSKDSISSLCFLMSIKTNDMSLYYQHTMRLLFLWKVGLAVELHWGCLSFSNFFYLSLSISIEINDKSLHFQCTSCFLSSEKGSGCRVCSEGASFLSFFSSFCLSLHIFHSLSLSQTSLFRSNSQSPSNFQTGFRCFGVWLEMFAEVIKNCCKLS